MKFLLIFILLVGCGGTEEEKSAEPEPSQSQTGCALERGSALPDSLVGSFFLTKVLTYENGTLTNEETVGADKTIQMTLVSGEGATLVSVVNRYTTNNPTTASGRVTLEGADQLAVTADESDIPFVFAGATYCLKLESGEDSFDVILEVTREKAFHYQFVRIP